MQKPMAHAQHTQIQSVGSLGKINPDGQPLFSSGAPATCSVDPLWAPLVFTHQPLSLSSGLDRKLILKETGQRAEWNRKRARARRPVVQLAFTQKGHVTLDRSLHLSRLQLPWASPILRFLLPNSL